MTTEQQQEALSILQEWTRVVRIYPDRPGELVLVTAEAIQALKRTFNLLYAVAPTTDEVRRS